jgi:exonuclease SbcC
LKDQTTRSNQFQTDTKNRNLRKETDRELDGERKSLIVWQKLRELIGSHDGAKFRKYAQSISLDILTRHANRHLTRLSDRYRIRRDTTETLNLQVEDLDQAGVKRPMASLSGGESFLVSLALALGLSDLAGRTVRIDSLFVDEGFGTLDPETLEIAIAALETLRQDNKTVGVISHVGLLKERISTQIVVEKLAGGVSKIRIVS